MLIYYLIGFFIILSLSGLFILNRYSETNIYYMDRIISFCICIFLVLFTSFRFETGFDYTNYKNIFLGISSTPVEPFFALFIYIFNKVGCFYFFLFFISLLSIGLKLYIFNKLKFRYVTFSILIYYLTIFLNLDMGIIRQGLAVSFIGIAFIFLLKKSSVNYFFFVTIACLFHLSAFLFFPLYFLFKIKLNFIIIIVSFIIALLVDYFFSQNSHLVSSLLIFFGDKYSAYANDLKPIGFTIGLYIKIFVFILFYVLFSRKGLCDDFERFLVNSCLLIFLIGLLTFIAFNSVPIIAARTGPYFKFFELLVFSYYVSVEKKTFNLFFIYSLVFVYAWLQFKQFIEMEAVLQYYSNYKSILYI